MMNYIFVMFNRMAIRTKNNEIVNKIIFSIKIFMMNPKNFCIFFVSTFLTFFKSILFNFMNFRNIMIIIFFVMQEFISTFITTIFSKMFSLPCKFLPALRTNKSFCFKTMHFIFASIRTIFSSMISQTRIIFKIYATISTYSCFFYNFFLTFYSTFRRTISSIYLRFWHIKSFITSLTRSTISITVPIYSITLSGTKLLCSDIGFKFIPTLFTYIYHKYIITITTFIVKINNRYILISAGRG